LDWEDAEATAHKWGLRSTTYLALWLAKRLLAADVPEALLTSLRPDSLPISFLERALPRVDVVRFDGHRPHPVNLAAVLLNDIRSERLSLLLRAPSAFPGWRQRVSVGSQPAEHPRTLILTSTDRRRGAEVFGERLRAGLTRRGWVVEAAALRSHGEEPRADLEALVAPEIEIRSRFDVRIARAFRNKTRHFRPEVVLANGGATLRYAIAGRPSGDYQLVYVAIGEPNYWLRSRFSRWLNRFMLRRVDHVIAVSEATRSQLVELEPSLEGKTSTVYTGVPQELFALSPTESTGPLHVLMIGSLTDEKDPERALRAVAALPEARLRFVGAGPLASDLAEQGQRLGLSDRVELVGPVIDVIPHLRWAHVLILTSRSEGLPGAILEASAAGVPTVAVDVGGVREAVLDGETGFVTARDDEMLAGRLKSLDADRELLARMGEAAKEHAVNHFILDRVVDRYAQVLRSVAK
jgi:glycosyltransferase involved in cell wall biosynthesis